ncbi:hypothetical protein OAQ99_01255 [Candidatus Kapabacteria bacterium]|nr:hypothetical protein [Candidatus Kapabacteria bacterium]
MKTLTIESNGRLGKTAVYLNGEQLDGLKELFLNLDEEGTYDSVVQYVGGDGELYTKNIFSDNLTELKVTEPSFTEEEANELEELTIESDGQIENTILMWDEEDLDGVVSLLVHIKTPTKEKKGLSNLFSRAKTVEDSVCKAEIVFRNDDDSLETERVF